MRVRACGVHFTYVTVLIVTVLVKHNRNNMDFVVCLMVLLYWIYFLLTPQHLCILTFFLTNNK